MSSTTTTASLPIDVIDLEGYSIQATFGTLAAAGVTGSFKLQASCDRADQRSAANVVVSNWTDVSGSTQAVMTSGSSNSVMWNVSGVYYPWLRLVYTNTAGSGSLSARFSGKGT